MRLERGRRALGWFVARYCVADPRTLGALRIAIGVLLCADCLRHWAAARTYYSNDGVLTNHYLLFRPSTEFNFSLFSSFSTPAEVHVAFGLALICYFLFAIGWHCRLFNALSFVWVTSMDNRLILVENGGYVVANLVVFWLMFLPTGRRFSLDSLAGRGRSDEPRVSLASFMLVANLAIVYVFNVVNKFGDLWRRGETVHDVLHLDRMVTGLAVLAREHVPYRMLQLASWATLLCEALIAVTILWPTHRLLARPAAMALMFLLHASFGVMMRLGPFSWFLIGWSLALLQRAHWEVIERWCARRAGPWRWLARSGGDAKRTAPVLPRATGRALVWSRELLLSYWVVCALWEMLLENASIPPILHFKQPKIVRATINYPRLYQGWGMFAPNPVKDDGIVAVDGYTIDGRRVDPFTGRAPDLDLSTARGLGLGQIEQDYANRIRMDRFRVYHPPLIEYLRRYSQRTGNPNDELVAFDVYWLRDECPLPGKLKPSPTEKLCLISWRKPAPLPPGLKIPPPCKETSGEKKDE